MATEENEEPLLEEEAPMTPEEEESSPEDLGKEESEREKEQEKPRRQRLGEADDSKVNPIKDSATDKIKDSIPGSEVVEDVKEKVEKTRRLTQGFQAAVQSFSVAVKMGAALFSNPWVWVTSLIILAIALLGVSVSDAYQVYGTTKSTSVGSASKDMLGRLAQRAEWLQTHWKEYSDSESLTGLDTATNKSNLADNPWSSACPNIVAIIYGLSPYLTGYNGNHNAYENWAAHPEMYDAYAFGLALGGNGQVSPGRSLQDPPAGAIVSIDYGDGVGHTFVMLTDSLVIDNWGTTGIGKLGSSTPRVISQSQKDQIVGWALPKSQGFEGSFITGGFAGAAAESPQQSAMPGLQDVPAWAQTTTGQ